MSSAQRRLDGNLELVAQQLDQLLEACALPLPQLPKVAVSIVRTDNDEATNAGKLADIIDADAALRACVFRIAASAAKRPATPVSTLCHAVAWLGFNEVANIAFTLALQVQLLDVPGEQRKARGLWRHALASALWARQLARMSAEASGSSYLCGLLHDIGALVALGAVSAVTRQLQRPLSGYEYDRLIERYRVALGERVMTAWQVPPRVVAVVMRWHDYPTCGSTCPQVNIIHAAHLLAHYTLIDSSDRARDLLVRHEAYRNLGLRLDEGGSLSALAALIEAELDLYLAP